ncbi:MAG: LTA synthase family protein [Candidatus Coatesbacteria bacterium]
MNAPGIPNPRLRPAVVLAAGLLAIFTTQRLVLLGVFRSMRPWDWPPAVLGAGLRSDLAACAWAALPFIVWLSLAPDALVRAPWHRRLVLAVVAGLLGGSIFGVSAEYFFFDEFEARFNVLAVDYLIYPKEVLTNIWQDYPVVPFVVACLAAVGGLAWTLRRPFEAAAGATVPLRHRREDLVLGLLACTLLISTVSWRTTQVSPDRVERELAGNGFAGFLQAAIHRDLDYAAFYRTLPRGEAYARVRRVLGVQGTNGAGPAGSVERRVEGDARRPKRNVVIIMVESFGNEFWGAFGRPGPTLTPRMDALAREGLLFSRIYACGDRTQRGLEGALSSFPPLPGESLYRRRAAGPVATIARTLRDDGYATIFLYNGAGSFDGMEPFLTANGVDRFVEQRDYVQPAHVTVWGVSDEDLLNRSIEEIGALHRAGRPFYATILTVSNHKPFTYPKGRIPERPEDRTRVNAVKYTDWALGEFFAKAKREPFWKDTIFLLIADHGARVYGSLEIPIRTYEIPILVLGPAAVSEPRRIDTLGSSLDVTPTVLGLLGRPYASVFFGHDLLRQPPELGRALINHNRYSGLLKGRSMVVLGLNRTATFYRYDPATRELSPLQTPGPPELELEKDAVALYQVADDMFLRGRFHASR